jgi:hypothetical protein
MSPSRKNENGLVAIMSWLIRSHSNRRAVAFAGL